MEVCQEAAADPQEETDPQGAVVGFREEVVYLPEGETQDVTTRQVVLLDLSSFGGSTKREFTVLVRSSLRYKALSTHTSQRRLVRSHYCLKVDRRWNNDEIREIQEVELKVLPLSKLRFLYIIEDALKLLFELRNPKTTVLG